VGYYFFSEVVRDQRMGAPKGFWTSLFPKMLCNAVILKDHPLSETEHIKIINS
jgi:hypothetical protein